MSKDRNGSTGAGHRATCEETNDIRTDQADRLDVLCNSVDALTHEREGSPETQPEFEELVRTIWRLRQPDGCPWDKAQTHESIAKNMIEEAYEVVDATHEQDDANLREELGDVLMQVLLHAQIAADEGSFDIHDVCRDLNRKLIRRHPYVFGTPKGEKPVPAQTDVADVPDIWDQVKREERISKGKKSGEEPGLLDSVPISLPALMQAQKISKRTAKVGFDWQTTSDVWDKAHEEVGEFKTEPSGSERAFEEVGDVLFSLVNVARKEHIDAEAALPFANRQFHSRWASMERAAKVSDKPWMRVLQKSSISSGDRRNRKSMSSRSGRTASWHCCSATLRSWTSCL